jgi:hypothetical protein
VLPISTVVPTDLVTLFESEVAEIRKLLEPGRRRQVQALARIRPLAILDATLKGEKGQPSDEELRQIGKEIAHGRSWPELFRGAAAVEITSDGTGLSLSLRLSKKEGVPIQLVPEGTPGASVVAVRRINELDIYSLGAKQLAEKVGLSVPKVVAVVDYLDLRRDQKYYKEFIIGRQVHKRYSPETVEKIKEVLKNKSIEEIWQEYTVKRRTT